MPTAREITILETLGLLDDSHQEFAAGIADDRYAIWLGAGVSLKKLPGLKGVSEAILEHLRSKIDPVNAGCPFRSCLNNVLALLVLDKTQRAAINLSTPAATWDPIELIKQQLVNNYAVMLDQFPATEAPDYLVWEGVKVADRYADPTTTPGAEHLGLAALIMEGVASDCASANSDDLVEKAVQIADGPYSSVLQVRVIPTDVQDNIRRARLYKFHGCAALAGQNEVVYRKRIVGRQSQIDGWAAKAENHVIAGKMLDLAVSKGTLMLGLSAQDANIQDVFVRARTQLPANFPTHPPALVVSENEVGVRQRTLLQNFYADDYPTQSAAIQEASLVRSFADALLPAHWLHIICAKLNSFLDTAAANLPPDERDELLRGLQRLRDLGASFATVGDHEAFMRASLSTLGRAIRLFHNGHTSTSAGGLYTPLTDTGVSRTLANPYLVSTGLSGLHSTDMRARVFHRGFCRQERPVALRLGVGVLKSFNRGLRLFAVEQRFVECLNLRCDAFQLGLKHLCRI